MEKKPRDHWVIQGKRCCRDYVFYQNKVINLGNFVAKHPGGVKAIKKYIFKDITNILFEIFPHKRQSAIAKLLQFQIGEILESQEVSADKPKEKKKVRFDTDQQTMQNVPLSVLANRRAKTELIHQNSQLARLQNGNRESTSKSKGQKGKKSKSKKKQLLTSIRIINDEDIQNYKHLLKDSHERNRQKQRAQTEIRNHIIQKNIDWAFSFLTIEIDQEKPIFRVPVLDVKNMDKSNH